MIAKGASSAALVSEFSMVHAAPTQEGAILPGVRTTEGGDLYVKTCNGGVYAKCGDSPCTVGPANTSAPDTENRVAASSVTCTCPLVESHGKTWEMLTTRANCDNDAVCAQHVWSASSSLAPGIAMLKSYLARLPGIDPAQNFTYPRCPNLEAGAATD